MQWVGDLPVSHSQAAPRIQSMMAKIEHSNIERVNIRFKVANTLRLANDSIATTKGGPNNIVFELVSDDSNSSSGGGSSSGGNGEGGDGGLDENPLG